MSGMSWCVYPTYRCFSSGQLPCNYPHFNSRWERGATCHWAVQQVGDSAKGAGGGGEGKEIEEEVFLWQSRKKKK